MMFPPGTLTAEVILNSMTRLGYATFQDRHPYDLNLFGIRNRNPRAGRFDDLLGCVFRDAHLNWNCEVWPATTDPGLYYLENPTRVQGTAILVPGQYRGVYRLDMHSGKYLALCQRNGPVTVARDRNRDGQLDWDSPTESGMFGINIHRSSLTGNTLAVGKWSAGCQVFQRLQDFQRLLSLAGYQLAYHPTYTSYTYTLMTQDQIHVRDD